MDVPKLIFLDIETVPKSKEINESKLSFPVEPTLKDVKVGNRKDSAEKYRKEKLPELKAQWILDCHEVRNKAQKELRSGSLDSLNGKILCVGLAYDDNAPEVLSGREKEIIGNLNERIRDFGDQIFGSTLVGFNVKNFDLEWLWHRSFLYKAPHLNAFIKYVNVVDLSETFRYQKYNKKYYKFDDICKFLGLPGKTKMDGSQVFDYWIEGRVEEIFAYCADDVKGNRELYKILNI